MSRRRKPRKTRPKRQLAPPVRATPSTHPQSQVEELLLQGHSDQARSVCQAALQSRPGDPSLRHLLAVAELQSGRPAEAARLLQSVITDGLQEARVYANLAAALTACGDGTGAVAACRQALHLAPTLHEVRLQLGVLLQRQGDSDAATDCYRVLLAALPGHVEATNRLGALLLQAGRVAEACQLWQKALTVHPENASLLANLAMGLLDQGHLQDALAAADAALRLDTSLAEALHTRGLICLRLDRTGEAETTLRQCLSVAPQHDRALVNLARCLIRAGRSDEALPLLAEATERDPANPRYASSLLLASHYVPPLDATSLAGAHREWSTRFEISPLPAPPAVHDSDPDRPLRVGYLSSDFRQHPVYHFIQAAFRKHDRQIVRAIAVSGTRHPDGCTESLRNASDEWIDIAPLTDDDAARAIRDRRIDILVDLGGHTRGARLGILSRRPAPIQLTWLGYPDTTGLGSLDGRLTDAEADPPGLADECSSEPLLRLPRGVHCYTPLEDSPPVNPLPAADSGVITFGSFNNLAKVSGECLDLWSAILLATPRSRLCLKSWSFACDDVRQHILGNLTQRGIGQDRVDLLPGTTTPAEHLAAHHLVDIALDTWPYNGTTTTLDALWMGLPVVSRAGVVQASRMGLSLLTRADHPHWASPEPAEVIAAATRLAADPVQLAQLRLSLRPALQASPLMDAEQHARDLEVAYRQLWRARCTTTARETSP